MVPTSHPIVGLRPSLQVMERLGFSAQHCLQGTGVLTRQLDNAQAQVSLQQEIRFYRNCLVLSGDPAIGLQLGAAYSPQRYGIFGYAVLSAQTLRHGLVVSQSFGDLTFTWSGISHKVSGDTVRFMLVDRLEIDQDVQELLRALLPGPRPEPRPPPTGHNDDDG